MKRSLSYTVELKLDTRYISILINIKVTVYKQLSIIITIMNWEKAVQTKLVKGLAAVDKLATTPEGLIYRAIIQHLTMNA